jgi:hypothetical protein
MSVISRSYPSLDAFYADDRRRRHSRERDIGLFWRGRGGRSFRAAWIQETGEVYLFRHGSPLEGGGTVHLLGRVFGLGELHRDVKGYAAVCGRRDSLRWLLDRLGGARPVAA